MRKISLFTCNRGSKSCGQFFFAPIHAYTKTGKLNNPDGKIVVVVMNSSDQKLSYRLSMNGYAAATTSLPHSISTMILE